MEKWIRSRLDKRAMGHNLPITTIEQPENQGISANDQTPCGASYAVQHINELPRHRHIGQRNEHILQMKSEQVATCSDTCTHMVGHR